MENPVGALVVKEGKLVCSHDAAARAPPQGFGNHTPTASSALTNWQRPSRKVTAPEGQLRGRTMLINGEAILENVRRYRAIASLHRQTAAFRPGQRWSLLDQAEQWEHLALVELEAYFEVREARQCGRSIEPAGGSHGSPCSATATVNLR